MTGTRRKAMDPKKDRHPGGASLILDGAGGDERPILEN